MAWLTEDYNFGGFLFGTCSSCPYVRVSKSSVVLLVFLNMPQITDYSFGSVCSSSHSMLIQSLPLRNAKNLLSLNVTRILS